MLHANVSVHANGDIIIDVIRFADTQLGPVTKSSLYISYFICNFFWTATVINIRQHVPTNAGYNECARHNMLMGFWRLTARSPSSVTVPPGLLVL